MFRPQAQAETHRDPDGPPLASASGTYFFLFLNRLQAQAHRDPGSSPRASRTISKNFFYFLFLDYKHKRKPAADQVNATHNFIDSPYYIGY
tara:strand:+ start:211 stop:483 length:273 start_codon:yes stop_codon:yes gene_type:complete